MFICCDVGIKWRQQLQLEVLDLKQTIRVVALTDSSTFNMHKQLKSLQQVSNQRIHRKT